MRVRTAVAVAAWGVASLAHADAYRCAVGDRVVFQDAPCAGGQKLEVHVPAASPTGSAPGAYRDRAATYERERQVRDAQQQIATLQDAIAGRNARMGRELDALQASKRISNNNLAGATRDQGISAEMSAVIDKYKALNEADLAQITALRAVLAASGSK